MINLTLEVKFLVCLLRFVTSVFSSAHIQVVSRGTFRINIEQKGDVYNVAVF